MQNDTASGGGLVFVCHAVVHTIRQFQEVSVVSGFCLLLLGGSWFLFYVISAVVVAMWCGSIERPPVLGPLSDM